MNDDDVAEDKRVRQLAWEMQLAAAQEAREFAAYKPFKEEDNVVPLRGNLAPPPHPDTPLRTYCAADLEGQTVPARQ